jgi:hypothetical protein
MKIPVIPMAVRYSADGREVWIKLAPPLEIDHYLAGQETETQTGAQARAIQGLTQRMHREICHLKYELGYTEDMAVLFAGDPAKWAA